MSTFHQLLQEAAGRYSQEEHKKNEVVNRWAKWGLLDGLQKNQKANIAALLENQVKHILKEGVNNVTNLGGASFTPGVGEQYATMILPMVRKVFGDTMSTDNFTTTQTMPLPSGLVFYKDLKFVNDKAGFAAGDSAYGITDTDNPVSGGFYGAGKFAYSMNTLTVAVASTVANAALADVDYDTRLSSKIGSALKKVTVPVATLTDFDPEGIQAFYISNGTVTKQQVLAQFTKLVGTNLIFVVDNAAAATASFDVEYFKKTKDNFRGDYETRNTDVAIAEYKLETSSSDITAIARKLKFTYSLEDLQDMKAYLQIDVEGELTNEISDGMGREIDLDVLAMIDKNSTNTKAFWSVRNNIAWNGTAFAALSSGFYNSQPEWFQTMGLQMNKISNEIHKRTLRGGANFAVVSPEVATVMESMSSFVTNSESGEYKEYSAGIERVGTFNGKIKIYKNPYYTSNKVLTGFRGTDYLHAGAAFCPYIPLVVTQAITDPNQLFNFSKGITTRYAKKILRSSFFGSLYVEGLETV